MQINNSNTNPLLLSKITGKVEQTQSKTLINNQRDQARAKEQDNEKNQGSRLDIDKQALARVAQFNQERTSDVNKVVSEKNGYDRPSQQNQFAVNSYRSVENIAQRESIQQTFGVDLFV
ncbi:hypothetical protein [Thalassotalea piscium]|uniref:Gamma-glutamyl phosphate reductase n=1 Tax=Thalassotalea piscium TaxID=1230533 RepID=A0A7X0TU29_9GAMM|nr:hypothetical protein [Thalassotalea piscium]MBB6543660.1 gamma-glutamyl phosphate reductase [Thalassotalea piscium]